MKQVAASILNIEEPISYINEVLDLGVKWIHYDLMDGDFVKNTNLSIDELKTIINRTNEHIKDLHLMVQSPRFYIDQLWEYVDFITIHIEVVSRAMLEEILQIYSKKVKIALAINPDTSTTMVEPFLSLVSFVLVMGVFPGAGGQKFIENTTLKISELVKKGATIHVDGGINDLSISKVWQVGAQLVVCGSYLAKSQNKKETIASLLKSNY